MPITRRVVPANLSYDREHRLHKKNLDLKRRGLKLEQIPKRHLFVETLEGDVLPWLAVFQTAPLFDQFRAIVVKETNLLIKSIRPERHLDPHALILKLPLRFMQAWQGLPIPHSYEYSFTKICHVPRYEFQWIGLSRDKVWVSSNLPTFGSKDDVSGLSLYVNMLLGLDEHGGLPRRLRQGPIPDEDEDALGTLAP